MRAPSPSITPELRDAAMRSEPDRYLAATLAPAAAGPALAAIAAFASELARVPASVSEPMMGSIRLQWWREALAEAGRTGERTGNPVADAMAGAVARHRLDAALVQAMIEAREHDLSGGLHSTEEGVLAYLDQTEGHAFRLALAVVGVEAGEAGRIAGPAGCAYGLARALGQLPMLLHNGGLPLPADLVRAAGGDPDALAATPPPAATAAAVGEVAAILTARARDANRQASAHATRLPRRARLALLPLVMVEPYFRAQSPGSHLDRMADVSPLERVSRIALAHWTGRL